GDRLLGGLPEARRHPRPPHVGHPRREARALMRRVLLLAFVLSCKSDFGDRESLVASTRILAVRAEPPEARPGEVVTYSLLVATPEGAIEPAADFAHCAVPKLLTENGAVSPACLADGVRPIGGGASVASAVPQDACFL